MSKREIDDRILKMFATVWLECSERAMGDLDNNIHAVFLGAVLFASNRPMSINELSKLPFIGSRRSAARWVEKLIAMGVATRTEQGVITTELGEQTGRYYFGTLLSKGKTLT